MHPLPRAYIKLNNSRTAQSATMPVVLAQAPRNKLEGAFLYSGSGKDASSSIAVKSQAHAFLVAIRQQSEAEEAAGSASA